MKLSSLSPRWVGAGGPGHHYADGEEVPRREGVGLSFECPCGCSERMYVAFSNPLDGGKAYAGPSEPTWQRLGDTFENLTLAPSLNRMDGCRWHGWIRRGQILNA